MPVAIYRCLVEQLEPMPFCDGSLVLKDQLVAAEAELPNLRRLQWGIRYGYGGLYSGDLGV